MSIIKYQSDIFLRVVFINQELVFKFLMELYLQGLNTAHIIS